MDNDVVVWLPTYQRYGILVQVNAHYSVVKWDEEGQTFEVEVENDDYTIVGENDDEWRNSGVHGMPKA